MKITVGPTGAVVKGHVLDCSLKPLEQAIKDYDSQLYFKWNPTSLKGWGAWELRRRPEMKSLIRSVPFEDSIISVIDYKENNFIHKIKDWAFINYKILQWLKLSDAWQAGYKGKDIADHMAKKEAERQTKIEDKALEALKYNAQDNKRYFGDFMQFINEGGNPADLAKHWK